MVPVSSTIDPTLGKINRANLQTSDTVTPQNISNEMNPSAGPGPEDSISGKDQQRERNEQQFKNESRQSMDGQAF